MPAWRLALLTRLERRSLTGILALPTRASSEAGAPHTPGAPVSDRHPCHTNTCQPGGWRSSYAWSAGFPPGILALPTRASSEAGAPQTPGAPVSKPASSPCPHMPARKRALLTRPGAPVSDRHPCHTNTCQPGSWRSPYAWSAGLLTGIPVIPIHASLEAGAPRLYLYHTIRVSGTKRRILRQRT